MPDTRTDTLTDILTLGPLIEAPDSLCAPEDQRTRRPRGPRMSQQCGRSRSKSRAGLRSPPCDPVRRPMVQACGVEEIDLSSLVVENVQWPGPRKRPVVEVSGGGPGTWTFDVLDQRAWNELTEQERRLEHHRAIRRRQGQRRRQRLRDAGPRDRYTTEQIGDRDGWVCAICRTPVDRAYQAPHPCTPSVHHIVEVARGGTDTLNNVALTHQFCNADAQWGVRSPESARLRLADRVLHGKHGPGRYGETPTDEAVALAAAILSGADSRRPDREPGSS